MGEQQEPSDDPLAVVPPLVGRRTGEAHDTALDAGVLAVDADPTHDVHTTGIVTAQDPGDGTEAPVGSTVTIWLETPDDGDDGSGGGNAPVPDPPRPVPPVAVKEPD
jgi:beta-lactam-binding protein with PASTA domain